MSEWPELKAGDNQRNCCSFYVRPNLTWLLQLHHAKKHNVGVVPKWSPKNLVDNNFGNKRPPLGPAQDGFKKILRNLVPYMAQWSMANQACS
mmetsp:Transcript_32212/g.68169  ORF Transcript_32212/g.68169 Transcript_32212/m.68169 type:complete len:92 (-) Transcript_32212:864-1139(-)